MNNFVQIETEIIKFLDIFTKGLYITTDNVESFNSFMRHIKQNARNNELYGFLMESKSIDIGVFRDALISIECGVEAACADLFLKGNESLLNEKLNRCMSLMIREGKLLDLNSKSVVLLVGSGSIPITGMIYNSIFGSYIKCLDIDDKALNLAQKITAMTKQAAYFEFIHQDVFDMNIDVNRISHIVIVGHIKNKNKVLDILHQKFSSGTKVLVRKSIGLYQLIYSDIDVNDLKNYSFIGYYNEDARFPYESIVLSI